MPNGLFQEIFAVWLRILVRVPRSILWLLRFPRAGEEHLIRTARQWAGDEVASRVRFSDVVDKEAHIYRGRVADLFLDTTEVRIQVFHVTPGYNTKYSVTPTRLLLSTFNLLYVDEILIIANWSVFYGLAPPCLLGLDIRTRCALASAQVW